MRRASRWARGDSLLEVLIALSITAVASLSVIAAQTGLARNERGQLERARATLIADSVAEGIQRDADSAPVVALWTKRAASMLPEGEASVVERGDGMHVALVNWRAAETGPRSACAEPGGRPGTACIAVTFAR